MWIWIAVACGAFACSTVPRPVPVSGGSTELHALTGEWSGEYHGTGGGRQGTIIFKLAAGADTAAGEVLMFPRQGPPTPSETSGPPKRALPQSLAIRFVRAAQGKVTGTLDPYIDPECGCRAETIFEGRLEGDAIEGTYTVQRQDNAPLMGSWKVKRRKG